MQARSFTQYGCSCNQSLKDAALQQGWSNNAIAVSACPLRFPPSCCCCGTRLVHGHSTSYLGWDALACCWSLPSLQGVVSP